MDGPNWRVADVPLPPLQLVGSLSLGSMSPFLSLSPAVSFQEPKLVSFEATVSQRDESLSVSPNDIVDRHSPTHHTP